MKHGKPVAKVVPVEADGRMSIREARRRIPGQFAHLRSTMREGDWLAPLPEDELQAWEGAYPSEAEKPGS